MSAQVETMFSVRENAWHDPSGRFTRDAYPDSIAQAREWAGLGWEPVEHKVYEERTVGGLPVYLPIEGEKRIARSDTGRHLRTVRDSWEPVGIGEMFGILEAVVDSESALRFETGGSLDSGRKVWALVQLDEPWSVPGDPSAIYPYVAFLNSFDGSSACKTLNTNVRVVCANTFGAADAQGRATGREFTFRHTIGVHDRIEDAKRAVRGFREDTEEFRELATHLAGIRVSADQRELFVIEFIPAPHETVVSTRVMGNIERDRSWLRALLADGSPTTEGIAGTAWGLVQAAGEFADHLRGYRNRETLLGRQLLRPEPLKAKAVRLATAVAKV